MVHHDDKCVTLPVNSSKMVTSVRQLLFWLALFSVTSCANLPKGPLGQASEVIAIGTPRDVAIQQVPDGYWYHEECSFSDQVIDDLFFYGSHSYDKAQIVIVVSERMDDVFRVKQIADFEPNAWHTAYASCIDRDKFEDNS